MTADREIRDEELTGIARDPEQAERAERDAPVHGSDRGGRSEQR
ncbi:hypothetical protein SY2F82_65880 [Streptomyces sp. Y2F8-2]|nr:hypothetical protein [Streptomyces sp. Y2F8-2]GHK04791.1 hypothetical protein SY2F82_65880 [Streptomyces sp. Y2F8-2]